jgi:hypothetical protein
MTRQPRGCQVRHIVRNLVSTALLGLAVLTAAACDDPDAPTTVEVISETPSASAPATASATAPAPAPSAMRTAGRTNRPAPPTCLVGGGDAVDPACPDVGKPATTDGGITSLPSAEPTTDDTATPTEIPTAPPDPDEVPAPESQEADQNPDD